MQSLITSKTNQIKLACCIEADSWSNVKSLKGVPSAVGFPHCAGSGEGLFLSPKPYPHKCAEAGAQTIFNLETK